MIAAELAAEIVERHDQAERDAGAVGVEKPAHVEVGRSVVQVPVTEQDFAGGPFAGWQAEAVLDGGGIKFDDFLDALEKVGCAVADTLVTFLADQMRGIAFGEEHDAGADRSAIGLDAGHPSVGVAEQTFDRGRGKDRGAVAAGDLGQILVERRSQDGVTMAERVRVTVGQALERSAVVEVEPALG